MKKSLALVLAAMLFITCFESSLLNPILSLSIPPTKTYSNVIGYWANSKQVYVTNIAQCTVGDVISTPNGEITSIEKISGDYVFLTTAVATWTGGLALTYLSPYIDLISNITSPVNNNYSLGKTIKIVATGTNCHHMVAFVNGQEIATQNGNNFSYDFTPSTPGVYSIQVVGMNTAYETDTGAKMVSSAIKTVRIVAQKSSYVGVNGTWANARQVYVINPEQCASGDSIITPKGETTTIDRVSGNYIFTTSDISSWTGGLALTYVLPVPPLLTPTISLLNPVGGSFTLGYTIRIAATGVNCHHITAYVNGAEVSTQSGNSFSFDYTPTVAGLYDVKVIGMNAQDNTIAGMQSIESKTVTIRIVAPKTQYNNVVGYWANLRQIYVTNIEQCATGDMIVTPNGESTKIDKVAGNYIFTTSDVTSWQLGKNLTYVPSSPTINMTSTISGAYTLGYTINIAATGTNCHHITAYANGNEINSQQGNNYSYNYTPTEPGLYQIYVKGMNTANVTDVGYQNSSSVVSTIRIVAVKDKYVNVVGYWANTRQIYVTNIEQCATGDQIITPNGESTYISRVSGNYIFTTTDVSSWQYGKALGYIPALKTPTINLTSSLEGSYTLGHTFNITATGTDCHHIVLRVNGNNITSQIGNNFSYAFSPTEQGTYEIQLIGMNTANETDLGAKSVTSELKIIKMVAPKTTYVGVTGTWVNSRQVKVNGWDQCATGDPVMMPNGQLVIIDKVIDQNIYTTIDLEAWQGDKQLIYLEPSSYVSMNVSCQITNKEYYFAYNASDVDNFQNNTFIIYYNPEKIEVLDACGETIESNLEVGYITGTNMQIVSISPGIIEFKVDKVIESGNVFSGIINTLKIRVKATGNTNITYQTKKI